MEKAHERFANSLRSVGVLEKMAAFDDRHTSNPMFQVFNQYMRMVMEMMLFVRAVPTGNWSLHLRSLEMLVKYFFIHDRLNYARMIPAYLAEMKALPDTDPDIYQEFSDGNWVVNKSSQVPFCGLGANNGLERVNRSIKVNGALVGIALNPIAHARFFLIPPELACL